MPETMSPREKVARTVSPKCWEFYDRHAADPRMKAEINHEVAPSLQLADAILAALASSGDHAELAAKAERCTTGDPWYKEGDLRGRQTFEQFLPQDRAFIAAANPATVLALIAESAALRGERDRNWEEYLAERQSRMDHGSREAGYIDQIDKLNARATEAERKLAEAVGHLKAMSHVAPRSFEVEAALAFLSSKEAERG